MVKSLNIIVISLMLFACNSTDKKFCSCMEASNKFNQINQSILSGNNSIDTIQKAKKMLKKKKTLCSDYQTMLAEEMKTKQESCN